MRNWRVGVDSGGTFTDICLIGEEDRAVQVWKVASTPDDPSRGIAEGVREAMGLYADAEDAPLAPVAAQAEDWFKAEGIGPDTQRVRLMVDMGMIFVTHNLAVVKEIADTVSVMYAGEVVEQGSVAEIFERPRHPYTAALLASVPESDSTRLESIPGTVPRAGEMPDGCRFAPRCKHGPGRREPDDRPSGQDARHRGAV